MPKAGQHLQNTCQQYVSSDIHFGFKWVGEEQKRRICPLFASQPKTTTTIGRSNLVCI